MSVALSGSRPSKLSFGKSHGDSRNPSKKWHSVCFVAPRHNMLSTTQGVRLAGRLRSCGRIGKSQVPTFADRAQTDHRLEDLYAGCQCHGYGPVQYTL